MPSIFNRSQSICQENLKIESSNFTILNIIQLIVGQLGCCSILNYTCPRFALLLHISGKEIISDPYSHKEEKYYFPWSLVVQKVCLHFKDKRKEKLQYMANTKVYTMVAKSTKTTHARFYSSLCAQNG